MRKTQTGAGNVPRFLYHGKGLRFVMEFGVFKKEELCYHIYNKISDMEHKAVQEVCLGTKEDIIWL